MIFGKLKLWKLNEIAPCYMRDYFQIKQLSKLGLHASKPPMFLPSAKQKTTKKKLIKQAKASNILKICNSSDPKQIARPLAYARFAQL